MSPPYSITNIHWYAFLVATGAASTAVEITGIRLLAPLFGSSLPVWGTAIAVVIGGLAWGYSLGGRRSTKPVSAINVMHYATLATALFLWLPAIFRLAHLLRNYSINNAQPQFILLSLLVAFLALLPPTVIFGMVSPLAAQVEATRRQQLTGQVTGKIFTLTTIGSLIGILIPSFITIPLFGTRQTIWIFSAVVILLALPALASLLKQKNTLVILIAASSLAASFTPHRLGPNVIYAAETSYQRVAVVQRDNQRLLEFDAGFGVQSLWTPDTLTEGYWDYLAALPALLPNQDIVDVLVLGSAASTTERQLSQFWPDTSFTFTSVDIDGALHDIANQFFDPPPRNMVTKDARSFVTSDTNTYDLIVLDTYTKEITTPFHLSTQQFFAALRPRLNTGGLVAINLNARSTNSALIRGFAHTINTIFPSVKIWSIPDTCNHLLLASASPIKITDQNPPPIVIPLLTTFSQPTPDTADDGPLFTDNRAPTDLLGLAALLAPPTPDSTC